MRLMSGLSVAMDAWQSMHLEACGMATVTPLRAGVWQVSQAILPSPACFLWLNATGCVGAGAGLVMVGAPDDASVPGAGVVEGLAPDGTSWARTTEAVHRRAAIRRKRRMLDVPLSHLFGQVFGSAHRKSAHGDGWVLPAGGDKDT